MSKRLLFIPSVVAVGLMILSSPALAQQKSVAACQQEWRANKAANQAAGVTEKAFVEKCRAGPAAAQSTPTTVPSAKPAKSTTPPSTAAKPTKTAKACESEWRANKAANQAAGITEKAYVEKCRAGQPHGSQHIGERISRHRSPPDAGSWEPDAGSSQREIADAASRIADALSFAQIAVQPRVRRAAMQRRRWAAARPVVAPRPDRRPPGPIGQTAIRTVTMKGSSDRSARGRRPAQSSPT